MDKHLTYISFALNKKKSIQTFNDVKPALNKNEVDEWNKLKDNLNAKPVTFKVKSVLLIRIPVL